MFFCIKRDDFIALLLCVIFLLVAFFSVAGFNWRNLKYSGSAITGDEVAYIASGYYSLVAHKNFFNPEHPPLLKDIAALPLFFIRPTVPTLVDARFQKKVYPYQDSRFAREGEIKNNQFDWGRLFLFNSQNNADQIAFWSRLAVMIFNSVLLFLLYLSLKFFWSDKIALAALGLIVILPLSLSHGSLVVLDFSSAILQLLAIIWFVFFSRQLVNGKSALSGFLSAILFLTLALLTKSSSLVLLPVLFIGGLAYILAKKLYRPLWWNYLFAVFMILVISLSVITVYYLPHVYNMNKVDTAVHINHLLPERTGYLWQSKKIILSLNNSDNIFLRGMSEYLLGATLNVRRADLSEQQMLYFNGDLYGRSGAGWPYYPVLLLTKIPLAILLLIVLAVGYFVINCLKRAEPDLLFILFFAYALFFLFLAMYFKLQMGLRYVLPVIYAALILMAKVSLDNWRKIIVKSMQIRHVFVGLLAVAAIVTLSNFPYYISYYNILAGGTDNGYKIAVDSNYDWGGQDIKRLAVWAKTNNIERIYASLFTNAEPAYYLGDAYLAYQPEKDSLPVSGSYVAISAHYYQTKLFKMAELREKYFSKDNLVSRAGKSIFIFKMP